MTRLLSRVFFLTAALAFMSLPASADTIINFSGGPGTCGGSDCFGNALTLTIHPTGGSNYQVTLTIDTTGNTNVGAAIAGVNFKFGGGITSAVLTQGPSGAANWGSGVFNSLNASGCNQSAGQGFGCSEDSGFVNFNVSQLATAAPPAFPVALAVLPNSGVYTWVWNASASGSVAASQVHVGVLFGHIQTGNPSGPNPKQITYAYKQNGLISASGTPNTPVPEPGTLFLFGTGLLGLAGLVRRRIRK